MNTADVRTALTAHLALLGWSPLPGTAIANKVFETAVGPKEAHAYVEFWPGECGVLTGVYYSEGKNALSTTRIIILLDATAEVLGGVAKDFSEQATQAISGTYAARLLRPAE